MGIYLNEIDPHAVQWLGNLIDAGLIPEGTVDSRDIREVTADDVRGYRHCHFFAGLGAWSYALELADWDSTRPVWTASLPCQPFSAAGKRKGESDERHLWPVFRSLVAECRPPTLFGEQVSSAAGRRWLAGVRADLEAMGYAVGATDLCAPCSGEEAEGWIVRGDQADWERIVLGPPHIRQRLFWVAHTREQRWNGGAGIQGGGRNPAERSETRHLAGEDRPDGVLDYSDSLRLKQQQHARDMGQETGAEPEHRREDVSQGSCGPGASDGRADPERNRLQGIVNTVAGQGASGRGLRSPDCGPVDGIQHTASDGRIQGRSEPVGRGLAGGRGTYGLGHALGPGCQGCGTCVGREPRSGHECESSAKAGPWSRFDLIPCRDGKTRRVESGLECLVDGSAFQLADGRAREDASRSPMLRGLGNAIVPRLAAEFISAFLDAEHDLDHTA